MSNVETVSQATRVEPEPEQARRFFMPDLDRHAGWLLERMVQAYPHLNTQQAHGWLRSVLGSNEFMIVYLSCGVGLFQSWHPTLAPQPVIKQHFVWAMDPNNRNQVKACAEIYVELVRWAKRMRITKIIDVEMNTDLPIELVKQKLGRINSREQLYATIS
jgi:hypothetical protein